MSSQIHSILSAQMSRHDTSPAGLENTRELALDYLKRQRQAIMSAHEKRVLPFKAAYDHRPKLTIVIRRDS